ncbi:hypothetical protein B0H11DRAFT_1914653 [Mycena galericulata]|nr:hypothetical protein B0H11DRAFT_1914653 [Mycena galericulata]
MTPAIIATIVVLSLFLLAVILGVTKFLHSYFTTPRHDQDVALQLEREGVQLEMLYFELSLALRNEEPLFTPAPPYYPGPPAYVPGSDPNVDSSQPHILSLAFPELQTEPRQEREIKVAEGGGAHDESPQMLRPPGAHDRNRIRLNYQLRAKDAGGEKKSLVTFLALGDATPPGNVDAKPGELYPATSAEADANQVFGDALNSPAAIMKAESSAWHST